jgi:NRAMP (natural resistance-associated macrophage protein)-like metal ion transporter
MSALVDLVLGIVTSIGGFVEAGSISTAAQAGSEYGFQLLWAIAGATAMLAMLVEMAGRLACVSKVPLAAAIRERFGMPFQSIPLAAELIIDILLLAAEIGGVAVALKLLTAAGLRWWILPVGAVIWIVLWVCRFGLIEYGLGILGLITLSFVWSAWRLNPNIADARASFIPTLPTHHHLRYAFLAVSILGATVSPYLLNFYSSGAVEEKMNESELWVNRTTAYAGMCFGGVVSMGVLLTSAMVLHPQQIISTPTSRRR